MSDSRALASHAFAAWAAQNRYWQIGEKPAACAAFMAGWEACERALDEMWREVDAALERITIGIEENRRALKALTDEP